MDKNKQLIPYTDPKDIHYLDTAIPGYRVPVVNAVLRLREMPKPDPADPYQLWQEGINKAGEGFRLMAESFVQILSNAFKPIAEAMQVVWANLGMAHKKRPSKQTRAFLATIRKEPPFTPHAHKRRRSQRHIAIMQRRQREIDDFLASHRIAGLKYEDEP